MKPEALGEDAFPDATIVRELAERGPFFDEEKCVMCGVSSAWPDTDRDDIPSVHEPTCLWRRARERYPEAAAPEPEARAGESGDVDVVARISGGFGLGYDKTQVTLPCFGCGRGIDFFWNGGELDGRWQHCCGYAYMAEHVRTDIIVWRAPLNR